MVRYIDDYRDRYRIEPICAALPIAQLTHYERRPGSAGRSRPPRAERDATLKPEVQRVFDEDFPVDGAHKIWKQLNSEGFRVR
jgi:hypothetical protein